MALGIGRVVAAGSWTRRTYLVDRNLQLRYAFLAGAVTAALAVLLGAWMRATHLEALATGGLDFAGRTLAEANFRVLFTAYVGVAAMAVIGAGFLGVLLSHRFAGPALLMRRYLAALAEGRYPRVRNLRKRDELVDLFIAVSRAIDQVRRRDAEQVEVLEEALEVMRGALGRAPELAPVILELEAEVTERREALELARAASTAAASSTTPPEVVAH
jgi:methyl-accepting chemotaxis protein